MVQNQHSPKRQKQVKKLIHIISHRFIMHDLYFKIFKLSLFLFLPDVKDEVELN